MVRVDLFQIFRVDKFFSQMPIELNGKRFLNDNEILMYKFNTIYNRKYQQKRSSLLQIFSVLLSIFIHMAKPFILSINLSSNSRFTNQAFRSYKSIHLSSSSGHLKCCNIIYNQKRGIRSVDVSSYPPLPRHLAL